MIIFLKPALLRPTNMDNHHHHHQSDVNSVLKQKFGKKIQAITSTHNKCSVFTRDKIDNYIKILTTTASENSCKNGYIIRNYGLIKTFGGNTKLVCKKSGRYIVGIDDLFFTIKNAHENVGHGGIKRTYQEIKKTVANVTVKQIKLYLEHCTSCTIRGPVGGVKRSKRVVRPIISKNFGERGQMDLINLTSNPVRGFKYILHYQDNFSKFSVLRPLQKKTVNEVTVHLIEIFSTIGAPKILQSDNGKEFLGKTLSDVLHGIWPTIKIINGRPRHPQSQGSVERANGDIENILRAMLIERRTKDWVTLLPSVQLQKNSARHRIINGSSYNVVFGKEPLLGFNQSFPIDILSYLKR